jgi:hypothetical protein
MADITYTVNQDDPNNIPGFENFSQADINLIQQYQINSLFDTNKHFIELNITDLAGNIIESDTNYTQYKLLGTAQSAGKEGASILTIDPIEDSKTYGYDNGGVKLLYHFLNDLYTQDKTTTEFFIAEISPDRTELQLQNLDLTNEQLVNYTTTIKDRLSAQSYFSEFRLNFSNNDLLIGINIDNLLVGQNQTVVVKLYEPLPTIYSEKSTLAIVETVSDSVAFEVDTIYQFPEEAVNRIRPANFNLEITDNQVIPTGYLAYNDLFSYPVNNTNNQLYSLVNEKGAELSIDHTDYANFVHFSSAYERLVNFKYKLQLIENYSSSLALVQGITSQSIGFTGSVSYFENLITGVVNNFDHYERFLYYESGSYAWPKSNSTQPYQNINSLNTIAVNWYANQLATANGYDLSNGSILTNSIPTYLRDDPNNENYLTFIYMIGQHFDNLWIYGKAVTDKYNADNRLDFGISKDLVGEALKNFGVKLYTSNNSIEDLFGSFIGQAYQSGSEDINFYITGSLTGSNTPIPPSSYDNYNKEIQKRIYHNLSHLVKTKGTERGLRALINCFGIPSDVLKIKLYGGRNVDERPFYGDYEYYTSSLDKIRLDHTGSLITGSTLSSYTSIYKRDPKYTDDLHAIEVGFSPTDNIDNYIVSYSLATGSLSNFNIDNYIGDPRNLTLGSYALLNSSGSVVDTLTNLTNRIMSSSTAYDVFDYVRLIKFFDNTIFKMVRDFIPARVVADTGIIIKPHLLQRNKAKSVLLSGSRPEYSGSIDTAFIESSDGETFGGRNNYITSYTASIQTPDGLSSYFGNSAEQPKYNGEFSGSTIDPTNGELNEANPYKDLTGTEYTFTNNILFVSASNEICLLRNRQSNPLIITSSTFDFTANYLFSNVREATVYSTSSVTSATGSSIPGNPYSPVTFPFNLTGYANYSQFYISASSVDIVGPSPCTSSILVRFATCSIAVSQLGSTQTYVLQQGSGVTPTNLTSWFTHLGSQTQVQYTASYNGTYSGIPSANTSSYSFTQPNGSTVEIIARDPYSDNCQASVTVTVGICPFTTMPTGSTGIEFNFSQYRKLNRQIADTPDQSEVSSIAYYGHVTDPTTTPPTLADYYSSFLNVYGVPIDPDIVFSPEYLQRPGATTAELGTVDNIYLQNNKDRGLQSFLRPYNTNPVNGLYVPTGTTVSVYRIQNAIDANNTPLSNESIYHHTAANPSGSDQYIAYLDYSQVDPFFADGLITTLSNAAGSTLSLPNNLDIAANPASALYPVLYTAPPRNYLIGTGTDQNVGIYNTQFLELIDLARRNLPVAYHIQFTAQGFCTRSITVYPIQHSRILSPSSTPSIPLQNPASTSTQWIPGESSKYIFVNKNININENPYLWGTAPTGGTGTLVGIPIRKRALI